MFILSQFLKLLRLALSCSTLVNVPYVLNAFSASPILGLLTVPPQTDMVESDQNWDLGTNQRTPPGRELLQCLDKDFSW